MHIPIIIVRDKKKMYDCRLDNYPSVTNVRDCKETKNNYDDSTMIIIHTV